MELKGKGCIGALALQDMDSWNGRLGNSSHVVGVLWRKRTRPVSQSFDSGERGRKKRNLNLRGTELCFLQFVESVPHAGGDCASPAWVLCPSSCPSSTAQDLQPTLSRLLIV